MHAMMSDWTSRERATMPGPDPGFTMNCAAYVAESEARLVLAATEVGFHDFAHHRAYQLMMAEALSAFLSASDPAAYLAEMAR